MIRQAGRALMWSYIGQIGGVATLFILSVVISRILSPADVGAYAAGAALAAILTTLTTTGLQAYLVREPSLDQKKQSSAFTVNLIFSLALAVLVATLGVAGLSLGYDRSVSHVLLILAIRPLLFALEYQPSALLQRQMNFRVLGIAALTMASVNFCAAVASAYSGFGALSLGIGVVIGALAQILVFIFFIPRLIVSPLSLTDWRQPALFAVQMTFIGGSSAIVKRTCDLLIGFYLGLSALGIFTRATAISDNLFFNIYGAFSRVVFAGISKAHNAGEDVRLIYLESFDLILIVFLPILVGIAILAAPIIRILFGVAWLDASPVLMVLMAAQCLTLLFSLNWEILIIRNQSGPLVKFETIRAFGSIAGFAGGLPFGLVGAASGRFADALIGTLLYIPRLSRIVPFAARDVVPIYTRAVLGTIVTVFPLLMLMILFRWSADTPLWAIMLAGVLSALIWLGFNTLFRPLLLNQSR